MNEEDFCKLFCQEAIRRLEIFVGRTEKENEVGFTTMERSAVDELKKEFKSARTMQQMSAVFGKAQAFARHMSSKALRSEDEERTGKYDSRPNRPGRAEDRGVQPRFRT